MTTSASVAWRLAAFFGREPGVVSAYLDAVAYRDLRIDLWDLATGVHGGPLVLDHAGAFFIEIDGRPMFHRQELDPQGGAVMRIYRLTVSRG